ncbi:hypothetical protein NMY3_02024 [Candidatus Nitrosocosmicus oleophilus]|uniref:Uncharacterized protein n=1 Tax=Candidatus Nitrosocosmicus oleophilus TaxID=1353260 RepID=A0A654M0K0_9ARCH|nr:hypothetical protein [Candidatus Nitrosocosmicus oleophilus]ALI36226.1 hypothetical protein NMY3_02024 [Candidatus Nitrosocosmicus oleophilus]
MANKPIFLIAMLFALITSMVTVALLSSYSMDIENTVYGSAIPQQGEESTGEESTGEESTGEESTGEESTGEESTGEESTGEVQNNSSISDNSIIGNKLPVVNSNSTLITIGCTPGYGYDPNSPNPICVPLDGSEKPEGVITCSALGCPYNPPNPNANQPIGSGNSLTK